MRMRQTHTDRLLENAPESYTASREADEYLAGIEFMRAAKAKSKAKAKAKG